MRMFRPRIRCVARRPIAGGLIAALLLGATAAPGASSELQYGAAFGARLEDGLAMAGGGLFSARLPAFLAPEPLLLGSAPRQRALPDPGARRGYTIGENLHAFVDYNRARTFARAPSRDLRDKRYLDFSSDPDRDVLGLLMAWSWHNSTVDLGYRLESSRLGEVGEGRTLSSFVAGAGVDHALTLGITRRWGAAE